MKPKDALIKAGFPVKSGRGRLSQDAIAKCKQLAAEGWNIEGYSRVTVADSPNTTKVVKEKPVVTGKQIADLPDQRRDERNWRALAYNKQGKQVDVGIKAVCAVCKNSLTYCYCLTSFVWVEYDHKAPVKFKAVRS